MQESEAERELFCQLANENWWWWWWAFGWPIALIQEQRPRKASWEGASESRFGEFGGQTGTGSTIVAPGWMDWQIDMCIYVMDPSIIYKLINTSLPPTLIQKTTELCCLHFRISNKTIFNDKWVSFKNSNSTWKYANFPKHSFSGL